MALMTYHIQNMKCAGCSTRIKNKLLKVNGITDVKTNVKDDSISFTYTRLESLEQVKKILLRLGYPLFEESNTVGTISKSYLNCMIGKVKNVL